MIWNDRRIREWASAGGVTPYAEGLVNPASLDLRLGGSIREPHEIWSRLSVIDMQQKIADGSIEALPLWGEPFSFQTYWLMPHGKGANFILCHSLEFVNIPDDMAAILYSKSSTGRRGVEHLHAGYGDPGWGSTINPLGFKGSTWTWEIHNVAPWPIKLEAGKPLMQQVMIRMTEAPLRTYAETGRYNGQVGPTPERPAALITRATPLIYIEDDDVPTICIPDAPLDFNWYAEDRNGNTWLYANRPHQGRFAWLAGKPRGGGHHVSSQNARVSPDWRQSLRRIVRSEDAQ